jgi:hypothetical protein
MNRKEHIDKMIDEALGSIDHANRAQPRPYLLTRIQARMKRTTESAWEKAGLFIGRPAVAFTGLCLLILINLSVLVFNGSEASVTGTEQVAQTPADEFSYTVATIYDTENPQP